MSPTRLPRALLTGWVGEKRPLGRPEQTFGHALKRNLYLRAKQLKALPTGAQALTFTLEDGTETHVHPHALAKWLRRTKGNTKEKTWIHAARYRELWKAVVYKTF